MKKILFATKQKGKVNEARLLLEKYGFQVLSLEDVGFFGPEPKETGVNFKDNALLKAKYYGLQTNLAVLADDSGLVVDALPGKLGLKSKRFLSGSDEDRNKKLLKLLGKFPDKKRTARFIAFLAFYDPLSGIVKVTSGVCEGIIGTKMQGKAGFGYDPLFVVKGRGKTFAQLGLEEKNKLSHRAKALEKMALFLKTLK